MTMAAGSAPNDDAKQAIERRILKTLQATGTIADSLQFSHENGWAHLDVVGVILSLSTANMVAFSVTNEDVPKLTEEGELYAKAGSPEAQVYNAVSADGSTTRDALLQRLGKDMGSIGMSQAIRLKWIKPEKSGQLVRLVNSITDDVRATLCAIRDGSCTVPDAELKALKKRKMVQTISIKRYSLTRGAEFALERRQLATDLTAEMLQSQSWKTAQFKAYNYKAKGRPIPHGALHPLMKVRAQFRSILLEMGFEEMPTNQFVESSFWNFDALFQPQQHPARDAHDTFFVTHPARTKSLPADYVERVRRTHENGGTTGSIGWRYPWSIDEAHKNLLRTHTTAISSKMLYQLAQRKEFQPRRYFSIDRVFRNETVDATHLAEFHQVEGLVADYGLTLGDLIGVIATFFKRIGISDVKFKPAYNPYTEPSMEIFGYSPELGKWMEVGNSGVFRPEMLLPMGLPDGVNVIAWGLSLERPTMIKYGVSNIRDLFGHKVDLRMCRDNPICRFD
ncbi:phenylalanine--tRNA ligase [Plasmodiophora brassicae]|nr:hypothetical protein PBRA_005374 [Plasmodiophora brassicae]